MLSRHQKYAGTMLTADSFQVKTIDWCRSVDLAENALQAEQHHDRQAVKCLAHFK